MTPEFVFPAGETAEKLKAFCESGIAGAEIYTLLCVSGGSLPEGRLFAGEENGKTVSALYRGPDYTVIKEAGKPPVEGLALLRFAGNKSRRFAVPAEPMAFSDLYAAALLYAGGSLSYADERRYVYKARCFRDGFYRGACVKVDGKIVCTAAVVAENRDTCLIGDVFTKEDCRGRGYASACVLFCVYDAEKRGKAPYVLCEEKNVPFYGALGFIKTDGAM